MTGNPIRRVGALLLAAAATWLALCLVLYFLFYRTLTDVYQRQVRNVLQVQCGRMIQGPLIYTLAPGECRFANPEFDTRISVDADGFRNAPGDIGSGPLRIATLGDSHAQGWGVQQSDKLSSVLARDPRFSVRDVSMSSYGTARELIAFAAYEASADIVVIQYCDNDLAENRAFLAAPSAFEATSARTAQAYAENVARMQQASTGTARRLLGTGLAAITTTWRLLWLPPAGRRETPPGVLAEEATAFAGVLSEFKDKLAGKTVIVWDSFPREPRKGFAPAFRASLAQAGLGDVTVLDLAGTLVPRDYFHIDEHMRAIGHAKVAARVLAELERNAPKPRTP